MALTRKASDSTIELQAEALRLIDFDVLRDELRRLGTELHAAGLPSGGLDLIGLFADIMTDEEIDEMVSVIYADRERAMPREVDTTGWVA